MPEGTPFGDLPTPDPDAAGGGGPPPSPPPGERPGDFIGPYKLLEVIGEGGFGVVYLAERREPMVQRVALKIIKPGMDSKAVVARFEQERQALAVMDHPNVAKVLDGGVTPAGRPYFVMEHVKGEPITAFADRHTLDLRERLELFIPVCEAVQHAHLKGIIHRDLKPSNILVASVGGDASDEGVTSKGLLVKVIDFGVAKAVSHTLTEKTIFTERGQIIGTPEYMSPEQAEMGAIDVDARTDVYSLGVVLYELLSGLLPFDAKTLRSAGYAEIQRIIREVDPPKPSTKLSTADDLAGADIAKARQTERERIARELRRELEWIPMKALRKDRRERYETPGDLAQDVRRYLKGEPLEAGPESATYRLRNTLKRYKGPVAAVAAVMVALMALVAGFGTVLWQAREAARQRDAEKERAEQLFREVGRALEEQRDAEKERAEQLKKVSEFQSQMLAQIDTTKAGVDLMADVRERFAEAMEKAGVPEAERSTQAKSLGDLLIRVNATDAAAAMIDRTILKPAIKTIDDQFKNDPVTNASLRQALADLYRGIGLFDAAFPLQEAALATRRRVLGEEHPDTLGSINNMGVLLQSQGKLDQAEPYWREALEKRRRVLGEEHPDTLGSVFSMVRLKLGQDKVREALELALSHEAAARTKFSNTNVKQLAGFLTLLGRARVGSGDEAERYALAEANLLEAHSIYLAAKDRGPAHKETLECVGALGDLYEAWDRAQPGKGFDAKAATWQATLDAAKTPAVDSQPK